MLKPTLFTLGLLSVTLTACTTTSLQADPDSQPTISVGNLEHGKQLHGTWGYANHQVPPEKWGDAEVNRLCKAGQAQSPIDVHTVTRVAAGSPNQVTLSTHYQADDFDIKNNGHTIVFNTKNPNLNTLELNGTTYKLLQFHYHIPSEHTVMNTYYPLEIHFVHANDAGNLAVIGVLVKNGNKNNDLDGIINNLPISDTSHTLASLNVAHLMPKDSATYTYNGSLTTPPCSEQVHWLLKATPIQASAEQLSVLSKLYDGNNRPIQPQGNRTVYMVE
ncbi:MULTISPECIES: carbonic anhydrase [unclassified Acinetobacter]|uniref:carbonic anhydrase n=1 Tax=unclassified Acinetobacter TaxID=196816 RepID=UPI0035B90FC8